MSAVLSPNELIILQFQRRRRAGYAVRARPTGRRFANVKGFRSMRYKIDVRFAGTATLEIEADSPGPARDQALAMTLADLARAGGPDIRQFELAIREMNVMAASGDESDESGGDRRSRPSGWYRPA
jgi:hypothetical protein